MCGSQFPSPFSKSFGCMDLEQCSSPISKFFSPGCWQPFCKVWFWQPACAHSNTANDSHIMITTWLTSITRYTLISGKLKSEKNVCFRHWWNTVHADKFYIYVSSSNLSRELQPPISNHLTLLECLTGVSNLCRPKQDLILNLPSWKSKITNLPCSFIIISLRNGITINPVT